MFHFLPYRLWNLAGFIMANLCLPVDILIFYKEPFGPLGTLAAMVFGFLPFNIIIGKDVIMCLVEVASDE